MALGQAEAATIFGTDYPTPDGTCIRDYVHIADLVSAHLLALEALQSKDALIYNVGSGQGFSVRQVIETARSVTGHADPGDRRAAAPRRSAAAGGLV